MTRKIMAYLLRNPAEHGSRHIVSFLCYGTRTPISVASFIDMHVFKLIYANIERILSKILPGIKWTRFLCFGAFLQLWKNTEDTATANFY